MNQPFPPKILALLSVCLLAGCLAEEDPRLKDNFKPGSLPAASSPVLPAVKKLTPDDEAEIKRLVFIDLLNRHFGDAGDYSAVFLQADDPEVAVLMKQFPEHVPPIKQSYRVRLPPNRAPLDQDTGRPAMILSVEVGEFNPDDSVDVLGKWYAGGAVSGFYTFLFKSTSEGWMIQSVK